MPSKHKPENASDNDDAKNAATPANNASDDDVDSDDSSCDDDSDEMTDPVPGGNLLEQIFHLQNVENANKLGIS